MQLKCFAFLTRFRMGSSNLGSFVFARRIFAWVWSGAWWHSHELIRQCTLGRSSQASVHIRVTRVTWYREDSWTSPRDSDSVYGTITYSFSRNPEWIWCCWSGDQWEVWPSVRKLTLLSLNSSSSSSSFPSHSPSLSPPLSFVLHLGTYFGDSFDKLFSG